MIILDNSLISLFSRSTDKVKIIVVNVRRLKSNFIKIGTGRVNNAIFRLSRTCEILIAKYNKVLMVHEELFKDKKLKSTEHTTLYSAFRTVKNRYRFHNLTMIPA